MAVFEYRVVPVPLAHEASDPNLETSIEDAINESARDGWEFLRIDTITHGDPQRIWAERKSVMIFRRDCEQAQAETEPQADPLVLTEPIFHDRVNGSTSERPSDQSHGPQLTIERAIMGARGGFSDGPDMREAGYGGITRSRNERPRYRST